MTMRDFYWYSGFAAMFIGAWWLEAYRPVPDPPRFRIPIICPKLEQDELESAIHRSRPGDTIIVYRATMKRTDFRRFVFRINGQELPINLDEK